MDDISENNDRGNNDPFKAGRNTFKHFFSKAKSLLSSHFLHLHVCVCVKKCVKYYTALPWSICPLQREKRETKSLTHELCIVSGCHGALRQSKRDILERFQLVLVLALLSQTRRPFSHICCSTSGFCRSSDT